MSDYLWDKSGEPDPEIERLEELLGSRRYEREPLRLPPEAVVAATGRAYAFSFYTRRVAVAAIAAGLVLAMIGGVRLNRLRDNATADGNASAAARDTRMTTQGGAVADALLQSDKKLSQAQPEPEVEDLIEDIRSGLQRNKLRAASAAMQDKSKLQLVRTTREPFVRAHVAQTTTQTARVRGGDESEIAPNRNRRIDEQRNAKEQLMFALRLTSTKLGVARAATQTAPASETDAGAR